MLNIVVLVSGGGTNLQALLDAERAGQIPGGKITCVIASRPDAYALTRAENAGVPTRCWPAGSIRTSMRTAGRWCRPCRRKRRIW